jgi:hypothetical protein
MTNELTRVLDAIKKDPHGEVARQASHWLAVKVMGWEKTALTEVHFCYEPCTPLMCTDDWQPFTDANHTRMLVRSFIENTDLQFYNYDENYSPENPQPVTLLSAGVKPITTGYKLVDCIGSLAMTNLLLFPYSDDTTHDACQVMRKCHAEGTLTDEILKGFLG